MSQEKRYYTRYSLRCDCILAYESGVKFYAEILDISAEGAKLRIDTEVFINPGDIVYLNIKSKYKIKIRAQVRWVKRDKFTEVGLKFIEMSMQDRESLSQLISEIALANLSDIYLS